MDGRTLGRVRAGFVFNKNCNYLAIVSLRQGHHYNGDQPARRPHILCSISSVAQLQLRICGNMYGFTPQPASVFALSTDFAYKYIRKRGLFDRPPSPDLGVKVKCGVVALW